MGTQTQRKILVTGALGQIGSELTIGLKDRYGADNVVATDIQPDTKKKLSSEVPFALLDVLKSETASKRSSRSTRSIRSTISPRFSPRSRRGNRARDGISI